MSRPEISESGDRNPPHVALLPSAGMGHLMPCTRLAVSLVARGCIVTIITIHPMVSAAESQHLSDLFASVPQIRPLKFHLAPFNPPDAASIDPFLLQFEAIRRSAHLLPPLLSSCHPALSTLVTDVSLASATLPVTASIHLPSHILFISSAAMLALCSFFPSVEKTDGGVIEEVRIPGLTTTLPGSSLPPPLHNPSHLFTAQFVENGRALLKAEGILINTFEALEPETLSALNGGKVVPGLPPVIAIGPQEPTTTGSHGGGGWLEWLDAQPARSVVYVNFGNRTALSARQIRELGIGLERSGCRFMWVIKTKVVDREEREGDLEEMFVDGFRERTKERGVVVTEWVDQEKVLRHGAVGAFLSHSGWNSVVETALCGVKMLVWPGGGDQKVNAEVVEKSGLGVWVRGWGWAAVDEEVVMGEEIGEKVREIMEDARLGESVADLGAEAVRAIGIGGSSRRALDGFVAGLKTSPL